jgi:hypothetical protein
MLFKFSLLGIVMKNHCHILRSCSHLVLRMNKSVNYLKWYRPHLLVLYLLFCIELHSHASHPALPIPSLTRTQQLRHIRRNSIMHSKPRMQLIQPKIQIHRILAARILGIPIRRSTVPIVSLLSIPLPHQLTFYTPHNTPSHSSTPSSAAYSPGFSKSC